MSEAKPKVYVVMEYAWTDDRDIHSVWSTLEAAKQAASELDAPRRLYRSTEILECFVDELVRPADQHPGISAEDGTVMYPRNWKGRRDW